MNEWSNALKALAPPAGKPGNGMGNIPYAPGLMSGKQPGASPEAQDMYSKLAQNQPHIPPTQNVGGVDMPTTGPSQQSGMIWTPQNQQHVLQYLMSLLKPQQEGGMKMTTTGGFMPTKQGM